MKGALLFVNLASSALEPEIEPELASQVHPAVPSIPEPGVLEGERVVTVTLDELLGRAHEAAPASLRARANVSLGDAAVEGARPWLPANPQFYVGVGARNSQLGTHGEVQGQLSQQIEIAGERGQRRRAAKKRRTAYERTAVVVSWDVEVRVRAAFSRAVVAREILDARKQVEVFNRRTAEIVRARVAAGDVAELQLRMAEGELALAVQARVAATIEYRSVCRDLAATAGWPSDVPIEPRGDLTSPPEVPPVEHLLNGLDDHPRIDALEAELGAAEAEHRAARRDGWPEPSLGVYGAYEHEPGAPFASHVGLVTLTLPIPLFRRNQPDRALALARVRVAQTDLATQRYELEQDVRRWQIAAAGAALRVRSYANEVLPRFAENLEQLARAFELGEIGGLEVVFARQRFADMELQALGAWSDYINATEALERATGQALGRATADTATTP